MPKRPKTSKARIYTFRLNPIHEEESRVMEIIASWEQQGYTQKQLIMDRVLRCEGYTPEMFAHGDGLSPGVMQLLFEQFAEQLLNAIGERFSKWTRSPKISEPLAEDDAQEDVSQFARNFAKGFMERRKRGIGDEDE